MRSKELNLDSYNTDKITHRYLDVYDPILLPWVDKGIRLLEIGIRKGGSLQLWRDYFPLGIITGIDLELPKHFEPGERIEVFEGSQSDKRFLSEVANKMAPEGFDIIIDDASHIGELTKTTFWHLFDNHLKPGGLYAIEDWGTGYCDDFPDGKRLNPANPLVSRVESLASGPLGGSVKVPFPCHSYGMVGFIKELVDEQGAASVTMRCPMDGRRGSKFKNILITPGVVFVTRISPTLSASPNPVPPDDGLGKTTISWNTADGTIGKVYVSSNGGQESLVAAAPQGSAAVDWICNGSGYEFRLYNSDHTKLLAKVAVTRISPTLSLSASPNPVPAGKAAGRTTISWNTSDGTIGKVYVSKNGGEESLMAASDRGSAAADWIYKGSTYEFRLYNSDHTKLLAKVVVTRATQ
jgi:hypothetical protein